MIINWKSVVVFFVTALAAGIKLKVPAWAGTIDSLTEQIVNWILALGIAASAATGPVVTKK